MWVSNTPKSLAQPVLGRLNRNLQRGFTLASAVSGSQFSFLNSDEVRSLTFTPKAEAVEFDGDSGKEEIEGNTHTHSLLISKQKCPQGPFLSAETPPHSVRTRACTHTHTHTQTPFSSTIRSAASGPFHQLRPPVSSKLDTEPFK